MSTINKRKTTTMTFDADDVRLLDVLVEYGLLAGEPLGDEFDPEVLEANVARARRLSDRFDKATR